MLRDAGPAHEEIDAGTDVVSFSAVQSSTGDLADLDAIVAAAEQHGAMTVLDATQACGWLPVDASRFDVVVCAAYKWLCSPRGTAFMTVRPEVAERLIPHGAGGTRAPTRTRPTTGRLCGWPGTRGAST